MANRRKHIEAAVSVASTSSSGNTNISSTGQSHDDVICWINITTATAGNITFVIQASPDNGTNWAALDTLTGDTGALTTTGLKRVVARAPIGSMVRLNYTIVTGPFAFSSQWEFSKRGMQP
jgi:hypothetical protein